MGKKIFISYSWSSKEHQDWVINLGTRLMNDTVDVELDKWSLKDGHDIFDFMEEMVKSNDIFRVLIVCDENYTQKADNRTGGVGTETQIITPEIYKNQKQEKFIPIVVERDSDDKPYLPIYLSSRKYIDFSKEEFFEESYEELLRNILEAPAVPKPKLGIVPPTYITENKINISEVNSSLRTLENQLKKSPEKTNIYTSRFLELYLDKLWDFEFHVPSKNIIEFGDSLYDNLLSYKILRDEFISFLLAITQSENSIDVDELISFFEKQPFYLMPREGSGRNGWREGDFDNYKIIFHELFIYTIAICLKNKKYGLVGDLLHSRYHLRDRYNRKEDPQRYTFLYNYHEYLNTYIESKYSKISGFGYYIVSNLNNNISKDWIILADTLCYIIGELHKVDYPDMWFPLCYVYNESKLIDFIDRLDSKRHFDKVKAIFDVETPQELIRLIDKYKENSKEEQRLRYSKGYASIPFVYEIIKVNKLAINR